MNNYFIALKPILNKLTKLNVFDSLDVIRKYVIVSIYKRYKELPQGIENPRYFGIEVFFADFLIKNSIIYSSIVRERESLTQAKTRKKIIAPIQTLVDEINSNRMEKHPTIWVSSYFFNQLNMQPEGNEKVMFYRYFSMYDDPEVLPKIENKLGVPLLNYFRMTFLLYVGYHNRFTYTRNQLFQHLPQNVKDRDALCYILSQITKSLKELRGLCKDGTRYDEDRIIGYYADSPHIKFPLIENESNLYCVVPAYILYAAFDHLYQILNKESQDTRTAFATNFEKYIGRIFESYFSVNEKRINYRSEISYDNGKKTSDWIIWDETNICFIDCKIKRITISGQNAISIDNEIIDTILREKPFKSSDKYIDNLPEGLTKDIALFGKGLGKIFVCYDNYKNNKIEEIPYMPDKEFHAMILTLEQNINNADEIKKTIIKIAQCYRNEKSKNEDTILDSEVIFLSSRYFERQIPLIAKKGLSEYMNIIKQGDLYCCGEANEFLDNQFKKVILDDLLKDIDIHHTKRND